MTQLTMLSLIGVSRGILYPIVIPSSFPEDTTFTVEAQDEFFIEADIPESIVEDISTEMKVYA